MEQHPRTAKNDRSTALVPLQASRTRICSQAGSSSRLSADILEDWTVRHEAQLLTRQKLNHIRSICCVRYSKHGQHTAALHQQQALCFVFPEYYLFICLYKFLGLLHPPTCQRCREGQLGSSNTIFSSALSLAPRDAVHPQIGTLLLPPRVAESRALKPGSPKWWPSVLACLLIRLHTACGLVKLGASFCGALKARTLS